ncbi:hypothetical protein FALCPG4_011651 [Fusarium falciforme]
MSLWETTDKVSFLPRIPQVTRLHGREMSCADGLLRGICARLRMPRKKSSWKEFRQTCVFRESKDWAEDGFNGYVFMVPPPQLHGSQDVSAAIFTLFRTTVTL